MPTWCDSCSRSCAAPNFSIGAKNLWSPWLKAICPPAKKANSTLGRSTPSSAVMNWKVLDCASVAWPQPIYTLAFLVASIWHTAAATRNWNIRDNLNIRSEIKNITTSNIRFIPWGYITATISTNWVSTISTPVKTTFSWCSNANPMIKFNTCVKRSSTIRLNWKMDLAL